MQPLTCTLPSVLARVIAAKRRRKRISNEFFFAPYTLFAAIHLPVSCCPQFER